VRRISLGFIAALDRVTIARTVRIQSGAVSSPT
jgi:hypothetical protein